jgi:geranylgeranyl pyrophosphate synthase
LDVLECVSLATQNISRGQVLEISAPIFSATPKHWRRVTRDKFAGLFGAGAQSAAYWGDASQTTVSTLFDFGEHLGMAVKLKTDLEFLNDEKRFSQKLNDEELWSPLCFLIHECMPESERREMSEKLENGFDVEPMIKELSFLFEKYKIDEMIQTEAKQELKQAGECLVNLEMDASPLQPLTSYSMI